MESGLQQGIARLERTWWKVFVARVVREGICFGLGLRDGYGGGLGVLVSVSVASNGVLSWFDLCYCGCLYVCFYLLRLLDMLEEGRGADWTVCTQLHGGCSRSGPSIVPLTLS